MNTSAVTDPPPPADAALKLRGADWCFLLLAPVAAWWGLRISLFVQNGFLDPWLYTGVGQAFEKLVEIYGWPYYFIRFPVTFLNRLFCSGAAPDVGFILLRYVLILVCGGALYRMALRQYGRPAAVAGYLFLFCNPVFMRVLNWDLTPFVSVPAALAGAAIWLADERGWFARYLAAGALFCAAFNAHIFTMSAVGCFLLAVGGTHLLLRRPWGQLFEQAGMALVGFTVMWFAGWRYYVSLVGEISPWLFWKTNMDALRSGGTYALDHARPFATWAASETYFYVPYLWLLAAAAVFWAKKKDERRYSDWLILGGAGALGLFYLVYRFLLGRFVIEEFYYFGHMSALSPLLVPLALSRADLSSRARWGLVALFAAAMIVPSFMAGWRTPAFFQLVALTSGSWVALSILLTAALAGIAAMVFLRRRVALVFSGAALFFGSMQILSLQPPSSSQVYGFSTERDRAQFRIATHFARLWGRHAGYGRTPLLWYRNGQSDYDIYSIGFVTLGDTLHDKSRNPGGLPEIGSYELRRLAATPDSRVFIMAKSRDEIRQGREALAAAGFDISDLEGATLADGSVVIFVDVVQCWKRPSP